MKNRFVKSGLDLEAKMNELDQKVEKKEEFKNELSTLDGMLDKVGAELLTVKDGLRLIENGKHELKATCDTIAGFVGETERMVKAFHDGLEEMMTATYQNEWTQESKESLNRILALYSNLVKNYLDGFCNDEKKAQEDFLTELRNVFTQSENTEQRMLNNFCNDLSNVLSRNGIWFTEKVSYWLLALFCTSSAISIVMIVLLITGNVHLG